MARVHHIPFAILDALALLSHPLDDAVDCRLLVGLGCLDVFALAQTGHGGAHFAGAKEKSCVRIDGGAPGVNHCVSWM